MRLSIVQKVSNLFLFSVTKSETFKVATDSVIHKKVLFGTSVSISKNGRLASCSHLEWTTQMWALRSSIEAMSLSNFQLGKCYTVENGTNTFSELLENVFRPNVPVVVGHHLNKEGKILCNSW